MKIMLVEDNPQNLYLASFLLNQKGWQVVVAHNGLECLRLAPVEQPNLVLMDILMPEMDGYETARRLLQLPQTRSIPIIAVTSFAMPGDRQKVLKIGFCGYLEKPYEPDQFIRYIEQFLPSPAAQS